MPIYAPQSSGREFAKAPAGSHRAVCIGIFDVGTQESPEYGPKRKVLLQWELTDELMEDGRPFSVSRQFTLSLHEKSTLRPFIGAWRGKPLTDQEALTFDIAALLGKPCLLSVVQGERNGKVFAEVTGAGQMPKGMQKPEPINPLRTYSLDDGDDYPEGMPEWIIRRVGESQERRGATAAPARVGSGYRAPAPSPARQPSNFNVPGKTVVPSDEDDDDMDSVPF